MRSIRRTAAAAAAAAVVALVAVVAVGPGLPGRFLAPADPLREADAILVFGGDPGFERTIEAARVYAGGYARYVVFSGRGGPGDSAASMAAVAGAEGVPRDAMLLEERATSTYENVLFSRPLLASHHVNTLILVTSPYHARRAYLVARHLLPHVALVNHPVARSAWSPDEWWRTAAGSTVLVCEYVKMAAYLALGRL